jgi:ATP-dependent Lhr-like helicase
VAEVLDRLAASGRVLRGAFRPHGRQQEWVDADVLRRLRRRSLAVLRAEAEPVEPAALARLLPEWQGVGNRASSLERLLEVVRVLQGAAIPASILESDVLTARMGYRPELLDQLAASGELVWVGRGPLGARDGRVALYLRDQISLLDLDRAEDPPQGPIHQALRARLADRGASFFRDLYEAAGGGDPQETLDALWDLVWAGEVTNDTLAPLRAFLWGKVRSGGRGKPRLPAASPPAGSGRWYLVADLLASEPSSTERAKAVAEQLLERYAVVTRDAVLAEGVPGGFSGLYPLFRAMEDAGRVRRGYYVAGLGGAQFALPGAVDRLRAQAGSGGRLLAAADPANTYGASVAWPTSEGNPSRSPGAYVITVDGTLAVFVDRGGRRAATFTDDGKMLEVAAPLVAELAEGRGRRMELETINGARAADTSLGRLLAEIGFTSSYKGLAYRKR